MHNTQHSGEGLEVTMENSYTTHFSEDLNLEKHRLDGSSAPQPSAPEDSCLVGQSIAHENSPISLSFSFSPSAR